MTSSYPLILFLSSWHCSFFLFCYNHYLVLLYFFDIISYLSCTGGVRSHRSIRGVEVLLSLLSLCFRLSPSHCFQLFKYLHEREGEEEGGRRKESEVLLFFLGSSILMMSRHSTLRWSLFWPCFSLCFRILSEVITVLQNK